MRGGSSPMPLNLCSESTRNVAVLALSNVIHALLRQSHEFLPRRETTMAVGLQSDSNMSAGEDGGSERIEVEHGRDADEEAASTAEQVEQER